MFRPLPEILGARGCRRRDLDVQATTPHYRGCRRRDHYPSVQGAGCVEGIGVHGTEVLLLEEHMNSRGTSFKVILFYNIIITTKL